MGMDLCLANIPTIAPDIQQVMEYLENHELACSSSGAMAHAKQKTILTEWDFCAAAKDLLQRATFHNIADCLAIQSAAPMFEKHYCGLEDLHWIASLFSHDGNNRLLEHYASQAAEELPHCNIQDL